MTQRATKIDDRPGRESAVFYIPRSTHLFEGSCQLLARRILTMPQGSIQISFANAEVAARTMKRVTEIIEKLIGASNGPT